MSILSKLGGGDKPPPSPKPPSRRPKAPKGRNKKGKHSLLHSREGGAKRSHLGPRPTVEMDVHDISWTVHAEEGDTVDHTSVSRYKQLRVARGRYWPREPGGWVRVFDPPSGGWILLSSWSSSL